MPQSIKCSTKYCTNKRAPGRKFCHTCRTRKERADNPLMYSYKTLRTNAKRRHKIFTISFEYFKLFCYETKYHLGKGRSKVAFTVDCIINELGYAEGNLQVLSKSENSKKGTKVLVYDWETGYATYR